MKYFGTDGIRRLYSDELTQIAYKTGFALSKIADDILIAEDTRSTSPILCKALASGAIYGGATVTLSGIMPTPSLSQAVKNGHYDAGVMITASHNPKEYNGIKVFDENGFKIGDETISEIERLIEVAPDIRREIMPPRSDIERELYIKKLSEVLKPQRHLSILLDCSNGATTKTAPFVFNNPNVSTQIIGVSGDINDECGVFFLEEAKAKKIEAGADLAFVFDGDGDRIMCIDEENEILDGDMILYILAKEYLKKGKLTGATIAGTLFSSMALEKSLAKHGIKLIRSQVGDRFLVDEMIKYNCPIGAEPSGHVVIESNTGDGVKTAVVLTCLASTIPLSKRKEGYLHTHMSEISVPFSESNLRKALEEASCFEKGADDLTRRMLVRRSGTEPVIRILIESESKTLTDTIVEKLLKQTFDIL